MASWAKKELAKLSNRKSKRLILPPPAGTNQGPVSSSAMPKVQEVVMSADLRCSNCQKKVAEAISSIKDLESIVIHVMEKKVTIARKSLPRCPVQRALTKS